MSNLNSLIRTKTKKQFPKAILKVVDLVAYKREQPMFYGSSNIKSMKYNSDYDLIEEVHTLKDPSEASKQFVHSFKLIVKRLKHASNIWLGDIKAGYDDVFNFDIGYLSRKKVKNYFPQDILNKVHQLYNEKELSKHEVDDVTTLIKTHPSILDFLKLEEWFRMKKC